MARARSFIDGIVIAVAVALAGVLVAAGGADAQQARTPISGWSICNETSYVLEAATARPDGRAILVQGWIRLRPGECRLAVAAPLARGTHYLYARTSSAHRGGRRQWAGDATLCVDPNSSFSIENPPQCASMGLEERQFRRVQINKRDTWRTTFSEAESYTLARARAAGIERLLTDAGYDLHEDRNGVDPRAIALAIQQFRAGARLAPNANEDQLIDALETAARRRGDQVGLTLCNHAHARVWAAIARRRGEGWESRGWWALSPGGCVRALDEDLLQEVYYVYASLDSDQGSRLLATPGEPFCTSPARFAILGREDCETRFYNTNLFAPIASRGRPGLVVEFDDRDFLDPGEHPRQLQTAQNAHLPDVVDDTDPRRGHAPASAPDDEHGQE